MPELAYSEHRRRNFWAEATDRQVLDGVRREDELALDELIRRKTQPLLQLAFRILGEMEEARDVVQLTFVRIWEHRLKFDGRWSPNTWIYRIATNLAIDHLRARQSRERSSGLMHHHLRQVEVARAERAAGELTRREVAAIFRQLSATLTQKQRLAFVLRELEDLSAPEVAEIMGCRQSTIRNHLFNARKVLRRELRSRYPEYAAAYADGDGSKSRA